MLRDDQGVQRNDSRGLNHRPRYIEQDSLLTPETWQQAINRLNGKACKNPGPEGPAFGGAQRAGTTNTYWRRSGFRFRVSVTIYKQVSVARP